MATTNLGLTLPIPNFSTGWGTTLNTDFQLIDNVFAADGTGTSVGLNVGSGKTLNVGGTLVAGGTAILGSGDGTTTTTAPTIRGAARTGTNAAGANLTFDAANGTGTGGSGKIVFRTAPAGSSGSGANTFQSAFEANSAGAVAFNNGNYGTSKQVLISNGSGAASNWGNVDGSVINIGGQAQGDILYRGASTWDRLPAGTSGQVLTTQGSGAAPVWANSLTLGTPVSLAGLSSTTFSSIPAGVKAITISFSDAVMDAGTRIYVELGTSSGIVSTGYLATSKCINNDSGSGGNIIGDNTTTSFTIKSWSTSYSNNGTISIYRASSNTWVSSHTLMCILGTNYMSIVGGGSVNLASELTQIRITSSSGTFNRGLANIQYQ